MSRLAIFAMISLASLQACTGAALIDLSVEKPSVVVKASFRWGILVDSS
jgi:hypothetical protein